MDLKVLWTIWASMGTVSDIKMLKGAEGFNVEVVIADRMDVDFPGFELIENKYVIPRGNDREYVNAILNICDKEAITTVIPQYGDELIPLSENIKLFEDRNVKVLVTEDSDKLSIANNKRKLYDFFKGNEFIPLYQWGNTVDSVEKAANTLGYPKVPVCIKPSEGEGGNGFRIITAEKVDVFAGRQELVKVSLDTLKKQLEEAATIPELLIMEYLPGKEYSVDCVCKNGTMYVCIPRERVNTAMGVATVSIVRKNDELIDISKKIIRALNLSYNVNLQFKYSEEGRPKLIEVNPRVSGSLICNYGAGVNMLEISLRLAYGLPIKNLDISWETKMIRYWDQIFVKA